MAVAESAVELIVAELAVASGHVGCRPQCNATQDFGKTRRLQRAEALVGRSSLRREPHRPCSSGLPIPRQIGGAALRGFKHSGLSRWQMESPARWGCTGLNKAGVGVSGNGDDDPPQKPDCTDRLNVASAEQN